MSSNDLTCVIAQFATSGVLFFTLVSKETHIFPLCSGDIKCQILANRVARGQIFMYQLFLINLQIQFLKAHIGLKSNVGYTDKQIFI